MGEAAAAAGAVEPTATNSPPRREGSKVPGGHGIGAVTTRLRRFQATLDAAAAAPAPAIFRAGDGRWTYPGARGGGAGAATPRRKRGAEGAAAAPAAAQKRPCAVETWAPPPGA
jgi:hypothetical protein